MEASPSGTVCHLDANVGVDFLRGKHPNLLQRLLGTPPHLLAMSEIAIGELTLGAIKSAAPQTLTETVRFIGRVRRVPVGPAITDLYARTRAVLEQAGQRMDDNDLWIAATALAENAVLVTSDRAFGRVPNLQVADWRV